MTSWGIIKKGKSKIVAGIKGQAWTIEFEENGKKEHMDLVVTDDKKVVDVIQKYLLVMKQFIQMDEEGDNELSKLMNIEKGYVAIAFYGMELVKFDDSDIANSVYTLPTGMDAGKKLNNAKEILGFLNQEIGEHEVCRKSQEYVRYETMYELSVPNEPVMKIKREKEYLIFIMNLGSFGVINAYYKKK